MTTTFLNQNFRPGLLLKSTNTVDNLESNSLGPLLSQPQLR